MKFGYKLFRLRKDGTLGPLFINRKQRINWFVWYVAEDHPTKGYAHRPGWHILEKKSAPHLSKKGRIWCKVYFDETLSERHVRPKSQGGVWYTAPAMIVTEINI